MIRTCLISLAGLALIATPSLAQTPRLQTGGAGDQVEAADGLSAAIFARRLGRITDMVRGPDGTLFLADREGGRIMRVIDRDRNGVAELTQPLPQRFDGPGGLTMIGDTLFVSDRGGVWRIEPDGGTPILIAPFASARASDTPAPLSTLADGTIRLGLNRVDGTTSLIDIDPVTGRADATEQAQGRILSFSKSALTRPGATSPAPVWVILRRGETTLGGPTLSGAQAIDGTAQHLWLDAATGRALIATDGQVREARAAFGGLGPMGEAVLNGLSGPAGPMLMDERGLFIAEGTKGRIWRVHRTERPALPPAQAPEADNDAMDGEAANPVTPQDNSPSQPELLRGSGIGQASRMGPASTMDPASTLPPAQSPTSPADDPPDQR